MPVRAYIAPIIGDGTSAETAFRLSVADLAGQHSRYYIPSKPDGTPATTWGFGICTGDLTAQAAMNALPGVTRLPLFRPSTLLSDIPSAIRTAAMNKATALGIDITGLTLANTYRDFLLRVAEFLEPQFKVTEADDIDGT